MKRVGTTFSDAANHAVAFSLYRRGMNLQSAFRAVNFERQAGAINAAQFRRSLGYHPGGGR